LIGFVKEELVDFSIFQPNEAEVDRIFVRSLEKLMSPGYRTYESYEHHDGTIYEMPVFGEHENEERIWGLTAFILSAVLDKLFCIEA
jgi:hypothetical protein